MQGQARPQAAIGQHPVQATVAATAILTAQAEDIIDRLCHVLNQETEALRTGGDADLKEFTERKSRLMLELRHATADVALTPSDPTPAALEKLRQHLAENQKLLDLHMRAVREISDIVAEAIKDSDSDGTYSMQIAYPGQI